jgi:hypothetical protein
MRYLGGAPLELPLLAVPGIILFLFFLIGLSNDLHHPLLVDGCTCQLIVRWAGELHQVI